MKTAFVDGFWFGNIFDYLGRLSESKIKIKAADCYKSSRPFARVGNQQRTKFALTPSLSRESAVGHF